MGQPRVGCPGQDPRSWTWPLGTVAAVTLSLSTATIDVFPAKLTGQPWEDPCPSLLLLGEPQISSTMAQAGDRLVCASWGGTDPGPLLGSWEVKGHLVPQATRLLSGCIAGTKTSLSCLCGCSRPCTVSLEGTASKARAATLICPGLCSTCRGRSPGHLFRPHS